MRRTKEEAQKGCKVYLAGTVYPLKSTDRATEFLRKVEAAGPPDEEGWVRLDAEGRGACYIKPSQLTAIVDD